MEKNIHENQEKSIDLEIFGSKINVEKHDVNFNEDLIKETGGVEGYERYRITWEELSKIEPEINSKETYYEKITNNNYNNKDFQNKIKKIMEILNFPEMFDGHSLVHHFDGFDKIASNTKEIFIKDGMLKQKIFDVATISTEMNSRTDNSTIYSFFDTKTKEPVDLTKNISSYENPKDDDFSLPMGVNILKTKELEKLVNENKITKYELNNILKDLELSSDIFYQGNTFRNIEGMCFLETPASDSGISEDISRESNSFAFNLNNKGFVKYLTDLKDLLEKYINSKEKKETARYSPKINEKKLRIDEFLKPENWEEVLKFRDFLGKQDHPVLPIIQSPNTTQLRWCHADRAFIISENGINFIKMKS